MSEPLPPVPCRCVELKVPSVTGSLPIVRAVVEKITLAQGCDDEEIAAIGLAIDEAMANVLKHGYEGAADQPIEISVTIEGEAPDAAVAIMIHDYGRQVDPESIRSRDLDDVRPGGLGVHIIRSVMDNVEYSRSAQGGMELKLTKRLGKVKT